jgi:hypothetical protein
LQSEVGIDLQEKERAKRMEKRILLLELLRTTEESPMRTALFAISSPHI